MMPPLRFLPALLCVLLLAACANGQVRVPEQPTGSVVAMAEEGQADALASDSGASVDAGEQALQEAVPDEVLAGVADGEAASAEATVPTDAEHDFAALYGGDPYDPVADGKLPAPAQLSVAYDPWEPFNRRMHAFNEVVDKRIALPLARAYVAAVPRPVRNSVGNFFVNLGQPVSAVNALLQGKPVQATQSLARFVVNITVGVVGLFDPASHMGLPLRSEDLGQTLGVWGWERSRYLELPLFGPRTVRDVFGMVGDAPLAPLRHVDEENTRIFLQGLQLVDIRTQLMSVDSMREGATDGYALMRDAWMQRRNYQIHGDRRGQKEDDSLPDYLQDDSMPLVPVDAIPVPVPTTPP